MHPELISRFPRLGALYLNSKVTKSDNYFAIYDKPTLLESTEKQFIAWETLLETLAPTHSRHSSVRRPEELRQGLSRQTAAGAS